MSITSAGSTPSPYSAMSPSSGSLTKKTKSSVEDEFLKYANMTPQQRMFDQMLKSLGISEDDFKNMSPADQQKVEQKIQQMIQQQAQNGGKNQPGLVMDKTA